MDTAIFKPVEELLPELNEQLIVLRERVRKFNVDLWIEKKTGKEKKQFV